MTLILRHWSADPVVLTGYVIVAVVHLRGLSAMAMAGVAGQSQPAERLTARRAAGHEGLGVSPLAALRSPELASHKREALLFHGGLAAIALALVSPLAYWSGRYLWAHTTQDVILVGVGAPLLVLGAPWIALRRGLPRAGQRRSGRTVVRGSWSSVPGAVLRWLARPVPAGVAFNASWIGWHLSAPYDLAARSSTVHYTEDAMFLGSAVLLWLQLVGSYPRSASLPPVRRIPLALFSGAANFVLVMVFALSPSTLYPAYAGSTHSGLPASADQQFAAGIMWAGLEPTFIVLMTFAAYWWLREQDEDPTYGVAALLRRRTSGWDSPLSPGKSRGQ